MSSWEEVKESFKEVNTNLNPLVLPIPDNYYPYLKTFNGSMHSKWTVSKVKRNI